MIATPSQTPAPRRRRWRAFAGGVGLQFAAALPAAMLQAGAQGNPLLAPFGLPVLAGGRSVVRAFEATVREVCGDRPDTMLSNAWWFLILLAAQMLAIALLLARRRLRAGRWRDPVVGGVLLFLLANSVLAADWPWWGT